MMESPQSDFATCGIKLQKEFLSPSEKYAPGGKYMRNTLAPSDAEIASMQKGPVAMNRAKYYIALL